MALSAKESRHMVAELCSGLKSSLCSSPKIHERIKKSKHRHVTPNSNIRT
jgi:hypothetical protein